MTEGRSDVPRWLAILGVLGLLIVLAVYLLQPGYGRSRLVLFAALALAAVAGAIGAASRRSELTLAGATCLLLLGVWQAVLGVFVSPVIVLLVLAAIVDRDAEPQSPLELR